jgi:chromatin remodeling complex protein RSC6
MTTIEIESIQITKPLSKQANQQEKISEKVESLETALQTLKKAADIALLEIKTLKKQVLKLKVQKPKKSVKLDRKPHGFAVPTRVSDELCVFMGVAPGSMIARTAVTQRLTDSIKEQNLQNAERRRQVLPDATLYKLLGEEAKDQFLTHFTIQKYINHHFIETPKVSDPVPVSIE